MAVVNTLASTIADETGFEPWKYANSQTAEVVFATSGHCSVAAGDDDTSTYRLVRLPANAAVRSIKLFNTAITAGTVYDFGLFSVGGAVLSGNCFANDLNLSSANSGLEIAYQNKTLTLHRQTIWQDAGVGADPGAGVYYDLVATGATVGSGAGTIMVIVEYTLL